MILNTFTRTVAANEGAHAVSPQSGAVQANIPIGTSQ